VRTNFEAPSLLLGLFAERFLQRNSGTLIGVSSVAGDRGRASNYFYGAAKAGFSQYLSGLRNRLALAGDVRVVTVKPGFVRTRMTANMKLPPSLTVQPDRVANAIFRADVESSRDVIYVGRRFWLIMTVICAIPEGLFKRLRL
jgi:short-subunit dehydrogenase